MLGDEYDDNRDEADSEDDNDNRVTLRNYYLMDDIWKLYTRLYEEL